MRTANDITQYHSSNAFHTSSVFYFLGLVGVDVLVSVEPVLNFISWKLPPLPLTSPYYLILLQNCSDAMLAVFFHVWLFFYTVICFFVFMQYLTLVGVMFWIVFKR